MPNQQFQDLKRLPLNLQPDAELRQRAARSIKGITPKTNHRVWPELAPLPIYRYFPRLTIVTLPNVRCNS
jgi:hypothetical protein